MKEKNRATEIHIYIQREVIYTLDNIENKINDSHSPKSQMAIEKKMIFF